MIILLNGIKYDVSKLIAKSPYAEKIKFLLKNAKKGKKFFKIKKGCFENKKYIKSNCIGTLLFVLGKYDYIEKNFSKKTYAFPTSNRPGFVKYSAGLKTIYKNFRKISKNNKKVRIIIFFNKNKEFEHSILYLGRIGKKEFVFQQSDYGAKWSLTTLDKIPYPKRFYFN